MGSGMWMESMGVASMAIDVFSHFDYPVLLAMGVQRYCLPWKALLSCPPVPGSISAEPGAGVSQQQSPNVAGDEEKEDGSATPVSTTTSCMG